ncbi:MAG: PQQ-dependent sugar dehydrogenase [Azospirillaceae bacterium]
MPLHPAPFLAIVLSAGLLAPVPAGAQIAEPDERYRVTVDDLPEPYATGSAGVRPETVSRPDGHSLQVPEGFSASLWADGLSHPREMLVLPDGSVLLAEPRQGHITRLWDNDNDGRSDDRWTFLSGHAAPYGMVLDGRTFYFADLSGVFRVDLDDGFAPEGTPERLVPAGTIGGTMGHWSRNLELSADGETLFVAVGSRGNIAEEEPPRATILAIDLTVEPPVTPQVFASGLRNPIGLDIHPETGALYTVVNERDGMGDGLVPDYLTAVEEGQFYGWPYAYLGPNPQPDFASLRRDLVEATVVPDLLFQAHSAPIDLMFPRARTMPAEFAEGAFVTLRGSWNRSDPLGYMVVFAPFHEGRPTGEYVAFATGFRLNEGAPAEVWGRPTGLAQLPDGSLLVADDTGRTIWRIAPE